MRARQHNLRDWRNMKILVKAISVYLVLGTSVALAGEVDTNSITTFQAGTPALASEVNANFDALIAPINDNDSRLIELQAKIDAERALSLQDDLFLEQLVSDLDQFVVPKVLNLQTLVSELQAATSFR